MIEIEASVGQGVSILGRKGLHYSRSTACPHGERFICHINNEESFSSSIICSQSPEGLFRDRPPFPNVRWVDGTLDFTACYQVSDFVDEANVRILTKAEDILAFQPDLI